MDEYIIREVSLGATVGPFRHNPLSCKLHLSPFIQTVPKDIYDRKSSLDLSFPDGHSVYSGIPSDTFINNPYKLHFPSVGTVARIIR